MKCKLFRKKPIIIEAIQLTKENKDQVFNWITCSRCPVFIDGIPAIKIYTLEGAMVANMGDWIIKGIKGEFYPIENHIFKQTYDEVKEGEE